MIHDITLTIDENLIVWPGDPAVRMTQVSHLGRGDICTVTHLDLTAHTGTHIDAPAHFIVDGKGVDSLDLDRLVGPALVVSAPEATAITAELLEKLNIPPGTQRLLIRTSNSQRWAAGETMFYTDFVAVSPDAAVWLVKSGVRLVGVDYLSVAPFHNVVPTHQTLLKAGIIPVEGLNLVDITPGLYHFVCLPLKLKGCDGAPARAILIS
jgi:arylformamidase